VDYLTVETLRAEFGEDIEEKTDAALVRRLDWLTAALEDQLGHAFGRALLITATGAISVTVTAVKLTLTSGVTPTDYPFTEYQTLGVLADAINMSGLATVTLLKGIAPDTPSTLLKVRAATACGPTYDLRQVLDVAAWYLCLTAKKESHLFLPLPVRSVTAVTENGVALAATDYHVATGKPWLIRRTCGCTTACNHKSVWQAAYSNNVQVTYTPSWWGDPPGLLSQVLLEAFSSAAGLTALESETFGKYSYRRGGAPVASWQALLSSGMVRQYATRFQP
jgi:hypothetical protein